MDYSTGTQLLCALNAQNMLLSHSLKKNRRSKQEFECEFREKGKTK